MQPTGAGAMRDGGLHPPYQDADIPVALQRCTGVLTAFEPGPNLWVI